MSKQPLRERKECVNIFVLAFWQSVDQVLYHSLFRGREQCLVVDLFYVVCNTEELRVLPLYKLLTIIF